MTDRYDDRRDDGSVPAAFGSADLEYELGSLIEGDSAGQGSEKATAKLAPARKRRQCSKGGVRKTATASTQKKTPLPKWARGRVKDHPAGFELLNGGVYESYTVTEGRGDEAREVTRWRWLCSPILVLATTRTADSTGWGRLVEVIDADGQRHRLTIPAAMLATEGADVVDALANLGLHGDLAASRKRLLALLSSWMPKRRARTVSRLGWIDEGCGAFAFADGTVIGTDADGIVYESRGRGAEIATHIRPTGTLEGWREGLAAKCVGNPVLMTSVALAFAGALFQPLCMEGGGLHLRGHTSRGKSTCQRAAVSVWGAPGLKRSWSTTANGCEGHATACNSALVALDEIQQARKPEDAGRIAYILANGVGSTRMSSSLDLRPAETWTVAFLSSGELSLSALMGETGKRSTGGQDVRMLDIEAESRAHGAFDDLHGHADGGAFADAITRDAAEHYGTAGRAFVSGFLEQRDVLEAEARRERDAFVAAMEARHGPFDGQVQRAAVRLGAIAAAGKIATMLGLTNWPIAEPSEAAAIVFALWLDGRGGSGSSEARQAIADVRAFLIKHARTRFEEVGIQREPITAHPARDRAGWRTNYAEDSGEENYFFIACDVWEREIHAGRDATRAARALRDAGFLVPEGKNLRAKAPRQVPNRPRVYKVRASILGSD